MGKKSAKRIWPEWYRVLQGRDLLYPENEFKFKSIPEGLWKNVQRRASDLLKEQPNAPAYLREHWQKIVDGHVPYELNTEVKK